MSMYFRVAAIAVVAVAAKLSWAQGEMLKTSKASRTVGISNEQKAAYASISDVEGPDYEVGQVAYESLRDESGLTTMRISDADLNSATSLIPEPTADLGAYGAESSSCSNCNGDGCQDCGSVWGTCDGDGCGDVPCGPECGALCTRCCPECCGVGTHRTGVYGEFLYLRPRNADIAYAVPIDGPIVAPPSNNPLQVGGIGVLDPDYEPGFKAGFNLALDTVSSLDVSYSFFESYTTDQISTDAPEVIRSLVAHPSSASAATDFLSASAELEIDFDLIDVSYRHLLVCRELSAVNYVLGARYAKLEQQFDSLFVNNGTETVSTDIDFEGGGIRIGLETERYSCRHQLHVFAKGYANLLAGRFRASYFQGQSFDPVVVNTDWEAGRVVPVLDLEIGAGWSSCDGRLRLTGGYQVNAWFNTLTTQEFVRAIQGSDYVDLGQTMTFDGLNARVEYRF